MRWCDGFIFRAISEVSQKFSEVFSIGEVSLISGEVSLNNSQK